MFNPCTCHGSNPYSSVGFPTPGNYIPAYTLPVVRVKKLRPEAIIPTKGTAQAAGFDLYAGETTCLCSDERKVISTGISVAIPEGYVGLLCSRSGMVAKTGVHVANQPGIIDSDYRGEVKVILQAPCDILGERVQVNQGDRIAQLVIVPCPDLMAVEVDDLDDTYRGSGGFGSTGVR